jgi:hypothetical protein
MRSTQYLGSLSLLSLYSTYPGSLSALSLLYTYPGSLSMLSLCSLSSTRTPGFTPSTSAAFVNASYLKIEKEGRNEEGRRKEEGY